ncbi:zinc ABC transporter substrate-binding protein [Leptolyngbya sp. FACHB-261]|nr:zinc ABC transporter substrate-binding protein [Leptolyngbya sp. FACHB-261]
MVLSLAVANLSACTPATPELRGSASPQAQATGSATPAIKTLKIVTTILPVTGFTKAVAGERAEVRYLIPTNVGPHDYQARPEDARTLAEADVLVKNGLGIEEYLDNMIANANHPGLKIVDASQGVSTLGADAEAPAHVGGTGEATATDEHEHEGEFNPHVWLDPARAIQQVENIRDGLIAADPQGRAIYTANAAAYIERLKALDAEFAAALKPYTGKEFVTYHDFAPYFAQRYKLKTEFLVGVPEENPAPGDVRRVLNAVQQSELKTLLSEPQATGSPFSALANDLKVQVSYFDPMETSGPEGVQPDYYFTVMRQNLKNLRAAFGSGSAQLPVWSPSRAYAVLLPSP